jgi:hypothetical protein
VCAMLGGGSCQVWCSKPLVPHVGGGCRRGQLLQVPAGLLLAVLQGSGGVLLPSSFDRRGGVYCVATKVAGEGSVMNLGDRGMMW